MDHIERLMSGAAMLASAGRAPAFEGVPLDLATVLDPRWLAEALDVVGGDDRIVGVEQVWPLPDGGREGPLRRVRGQGAASAAMPCARKRTSTTGSTRCSPRRTSTETCGPAWRSGRRGPTTGIDEAANRGLIVMDDVMALGGRFLDAHEPYSLATCRDALSRSPSSTPAHGAARRTGLARAPASRAWPPCSPPTRSRTCSTTVGAPICRPPCATPTLQAAMRRTAEVAPTCVLHGDTHSGNAYLDRDGRVCWLDWQITQRGHWSIDVSYHLGTVLDAETRRAHEAHLLRHYLDELRGHGVDPPVVRRGLGAVHARLHLGLLPVDHHPHQLRAIVLLNVPRLGAALADHDTFRRLGVA